MPSYAPCEIVIYLDNENKQLIPHFTEQVCPVTLSPSVQKKLHSMLDEKGNYSKARLLEFISQELPTSLRTYIHLKALVKAYSNSLKNELVPLFEEHSSNERILQALGQVMESNECHSLYVLPFQTEKNAPLISEVLKAIK